MLGMVDISSLPFPTSTGYVVSVNTILLTVNEDGSFHESGDLQISESGYSFGDVVVTLTPLSYSQYEQQTDQRVAATFPSRPDEASGSHHTSHSDFYSYLEANI